MFFPTETPPYRLPVFVTVCNLSLATQARDTFVTVPSSDMLLHPTDSNYLIQARVRLEDDIPTGIYGLARIVWAKFHTQEPDGPSPVASGGNPAKPLMVCDGSHAPTKACTDPDCWLIDKPDKDGHD